LDEEGQVDGDKNVEMIVKERTPPERDGLES
jgi:hypothetical protein